MHTMDEKRVYTDESEVETLYLASGLGIVSVSVSDGRIGEFGVCHRCRARDVAVGGPYVAAATDDDVVVRTRRAESGTGFVATGFGPATAVGFRDGRLLAGDADGRVARFKPDDAGNPADGTWESVGSTGEVRAVDGDFLAAADGAYRISRSGLRPVGLDDARDVDGEPLAATGAGLYKLGNGWMEVRPEPATAVDAAGDRGLAVCGGDLYARDPGGEWVDAGLPAGGNDEVAAVTHGEEAAYAVTESGRVAARLPNEEWRDRSVGVENVAAAVV